MFYSSRSLFLTSTELFPFPLACVLKNKLRTTLSPFSSLGVHSTRGNRHLALQSYGVKWMIWQDERCEWMAKLLKEAM